MYKIKAFIKNHYISIITALFFGLIVISPNFIFFDDFGFHKLNPVYPDFSDEETYYEARVSNIIRGNLGVSNVYLKEHFESSFLVPPLADWIVAIPSVFFKISGPLLIIFSDLFFTIVNFLLLYFVFYEISRKKFQSILYSSFYFLIFLQIMGRPINPQVTLTFLFLGFLFLYKISNYNEDSNDRIKYYNLVSGILIGISFFVSPYVGSALLVLYGLLVILKNIINFGFIETFKRNLYFIIPFSPIFICYVAMMYRIQGLANYLDSSIRFGLINTHVLSINTNILLGLVCLFYLQIIRKYLTIKTRYFSYVLTSSIFILNWQNLITGKLIQFSSHYYMISVFIVMIVIFFVNNNLDLREKKYIKLFNVSFLLILAILVMYKQRNEFYIWNNVPDRVSYNQTVKKVNIMDWINENVPENSVFYTLGDNYDYLIPIYTKSKVYFNFYATLSLVSNFELEDRWLNQNIFNPNFNKDYIRDNQREFWCNRFLDRYSLEENRKKIFSLLTFNEYKPGIMIEDELLEDMYGRFQNKIDIDPVDLIEEYDADYIILSPKYEYYKDTLDKLYNHKRLKEVVIMDGVHIFKILKK